MIFFVISGYCIAATTTSTLRNSQGFGIYMRRRLRRIYPPYFFAVCFFIVTRLMKWRMGQGMQLSSSFVTWLQTFTLTQWLSLIWHPVSSPAANKALFVAAFWSLNYEEQFYLVMGGLMILSARLGWPMLCGIVGLLIPAFAWNLAYPSTSYGFFLEYWVQFSLGAIVFYRLCVMTKASERRVAEGGLLILTSASGLVWAFHKGPGIAIQRFVYWEWFITGTFALFLIGVRSLDEATVRTWFGSQLIGVGAITLQPVPDPSIQPIANVVQPMQ